MKAAFARLAWIVVLSACGGGGGGSGEGTVPASPAPAVLPPRILVFVAYNRVWWAEYKVLREALASAGYEVEVRSSSEGYATSSQTDGTIESSANSLAGSSYSEFQNSFASAFGSPWSASWNPPGSIPLAGRIQDVPSLSDYRAFAIVGGIGAVDYRFDGSYADSVEGTHASPGADVRAAAEKIQQLVLEAEAAGKPVLAECHGASLPLFVRVPGSAGQEPSPDSLGRSILEGRSMRGLTGTDIGAACAGFDVAYRPNRVVVAEGGVITSRDWYPQTVVHACKTMLNVLARHPEAAALTAPTSVLILHGGPCDPGNPSNDIPANYGMTPESVVPVDYLDLVALLSADSPSDPFSFVVAQVNLLGGGLPFDPNDAASALTYLSGFDVVLIFKHWSTGFPDALQAALRDYADGGGGLLALHHALYNSVNGGNKNILCQQVFGAESAAATWSARHPDSGPYGYMTTNYGHFISTYGVSYADAPASLPAAVPVSNRSSSGYPALFLTDEIYNNLTFTGTPVFGNGVGEISPLFANDHTAQMNQVPTAGFVKRFNPSGDASEGRLVYLQPGERVENFQLGHPYAQILRNAAVWVAQAD